MLYFKDYRELIEYGIDVRDTLNGCVALIVEPDVFGDAYDILRDNGYTIPYIECDDEWDFISVEIASDNLAYIEPIMRKGQYLMHSSDLIIMHEDVPSKFQLSQKEVDAFEVFTFDEETMCDNELKECDKCKHCDCDNGYYDLYFDDDELVGFTHTDSGELDGVKYKTSMSYYSSDIDYLTKILKKFL